MNRVKKKKYSQAFAARKFWQIFHQESNQRSVLEKYFISIEASSRFSDTFNLKEKAII
jgi:hypothetical protein